MQKNKVINFSRFVARNLQRLFAAKRQLGAKSTTQLYNKPAPGNGNPSITVYFPRIIAG